MSLILEQTVLGILLAQENLENPQVSEALFLVNRNHFESIQHQIIFEHLRQTNLNNKPVNWIEIEGADFAYLAELAKNARNIANLRYYAKELDKASRLRKVKEKLKSTYNAVTKTDSLNEGLKLVDDLSKIVFQSTPSGHNFDSAAEINRHVYDYYETTESDERLPTNDQLLDSILGGGILKPSINVIAGQSGTGKTTFAAKMMDGLCLHNNFQCAMFSLEMTTLRVAEMLLCQNKQIPRKEFKDKGSEFFRKPLDQMLERNNLHICPNKSMSIEEIFSKSRYLNAKYGLDFVFIDFLTALGVEKKCASEYEQLNHIMKTIADIAGELNVAVVLLAQLNRGLANSKDGKPALWHLKGSSSIENFADHVLFVHRDSITNPDCPHNYLEMIVAKNRYGELGSIFYESRDGTIFNAEQEEAITEVKHWENRKNKPAPDGFSF